MSDNKYARDKTFSKSKLQAENVVELETHDAKWVKMSEVEAKTQPWFWPGLIPDETLTLFAGHGGIGKSLLLLYIAAKTTTGESFSAGGVTHQLPKGKVILLSAEDDEEYQIKPKLIAAGANFDHIHYLKFKVDKATEKEKFIQLDRDLKLIEDKIILEKDIKLMIIDPITYFIGDIRDHYNSDVANFLQSLISMAKKHKIAVVLNKHLRKQSTGGKGPNSAADEVGGAGAWTNSPRRCLLITNHHEDEEIKCITKMKDNLGKQEKEALGYKIEAATVIENDKSISTTQLVWMNEMQKITSDEAVNEEKYEKSKKQIAVDFIINHLKDNGESVLKNIESSAFNTGIKGRTFDEAVKILKNDERIKITDGIYPNKCWQYIP